jgi:hypothetical protein
VNGASLTTLTNGYLTGVFEDKAVQWQGLYTPPTTGVYTFYSNTDDASYIWVGEPATYTTSSNIFYQTTTSNALVQNGGYHNSGVAKVVNGVY